MKSLAKKIVATALTVASIATMTTCVATANAANMEYHIDTTRKASLTLHKYEMSDTSLATHKATGTTDDAQYVPADAKPLANVQFTAYKVAELDKYFKPDGIELPAASAVKTSEATATFSAVTGEDGVATFTDLPLGIYYVEETDGPAQVTKKISPFVISLPMTSVDGSKWLYDIHCYPKNQTAYGGVTLQKVDSVTKKPLKGATFTLYSSEDGKTYTEYMTGLKTGDNGTAVVNSLPSQTYYKFVETAASDPSYILDSTVGYEFYIDATGDMIVNDEVVDNKTVVVENDTVDIEKYVLDGKKGAEGIDNTVNYGDTVYWKIKTSIPTKTAEKLKTYTIVDTMSKGLKYQSAELWIDDTKQLKEKTDYTVSQSGLEVTFTIKPSSIKGGKEVEVYFNTELTTDAPLAQDVPNTSKLIYTNDIGTDSKFTKNSQTPTVHTGGYSFVKTDGSKPLEGAEFAIYRTEVDAKNGTNAILTATSNDKGIVEFKGLQYGAFSVDEDGKNKNGVENGSTKYWIAETKAPNGYVLLSAPFEVTVNATSHISSNTPSVKNNTIPELPVTGAAGTVTLFVIAAALVGTGVLILSVRRKKRDR